MEFMNYCNENFMTIGEKMKETFDKEENVFFDYADPMSGILQNS